MRAFVAVTRKISAISLVLPGTNSVISLIYMTAYWNHPFEPRVLWPPKRGRRIKRRGAGRAEGMDLCTQRLHRDLKPPGRHLKNICGFQSDSAVAVYMRQ